MLIFFFTRCALWIPVVHSKFYGSLIIQTCMSFQSRAHSLTFPFPRRLLKLCVKGIKKNGLKRNDTKQDSLLEDCLLDVLKVMLNITHDYGKCPATCVCRLEKNSGNSESGVHVLSEIQKLKYNHLYLRFEDVSVCLGGDECQVGLAVNYMGIWRWLLG